ncbi:DNA cytosine methyltransferase [Nitrosomonas sp. Nm132]|uniref:DNA cytosine methyltransferase n=1 Tax=Nitrosomonas sp. Nm132 TaxID=1881053 RepID=UPI00088C28D0|nr:DNA cytosine methyltransferase [Nitrosomonas sp. Nm132]SDH26646.1 DNA (cytosine-5)-methyltransferase 1 [Nitrosomonas sp. Nm132]
MNFDLLRPFGFYEFFAGGGMARLGLGDAWECHFANDFDGKKTASYRINFNRAPELLISDVRNITASQLPGKATLSWASFPCQDLSLAGSGAGLAGERSGVFWPFWNLMLSLKREGRNPPIIVLENVAGLITSHNGQDLATLISSLANADYRVGAVLLDGAYFVAQSRPRLFIIAVTRGVGIPKFLSGRVPNPTWHPQSLQDVVEALPHKSRKAWVWWKMPMPDQEAPHLSDIIENEPHGVKWHSESETLKLLNMMSPANLEKVHEAQKSSSRQVGTIYKRTRFGIQRAEVRFDGVSGCLRTPAGGSSRQIIMVVEGRHIRSRLISPRETARLMGLPESYILPERYNDAYHLTGDGVVVPVVAWLEQHIIRPIAMSTCKAKGRQLVSEATLA